MAYRLDDQTCALLILPELPDETLSLRVVEPEHADEVRARVLAKTSIELTRQEVYRGVQFIRLNPDPAHPALATVTLYDGYLRTTDPVKIVMGLRTRLQYEQTHMRVTESGLIVPFREAIGRVMPQRLPMADAMIDRYQEAERLVASVFPNGRV